MKIAPSIKRFGFGAAAALVLTSCLSEMPRPFPTQPNLPGFVPSFVPVVTSPLTLASSRYKPNKIKYSNTGRKATSAQSGNMVLEFRALQARNGVTTIEATSGEFEERPGVDVIEKATLRILSAPTAAPIQAWPNAPQWSYAMMGLVPGDMVHMQASVKPRGVAKTEIFRVTDTVYRRPDLAIMELRSPATAHVGMPAMFAVSVGELNGEWGARANCVLSINGSPVDAAARIWVDAGDVVACLFSYVFQLPGTYTVSASVVDVGPSDWDEANNSATQQVTVVSPGTPISVGALAVIEEAYSVSNSQVRTGDYPIQAANGSEQLVSTVDFESDLPELVPGPLQRFEIKVTQGTEVLFDTSITELTTYQFTSMGAATKCAVYSGNEHDLSVCSKTNPDGSVVTEYDYWRTSGTVTYYAQTLWCSLSGCNTYNDSGARTTGTGRHFGLIAGDEVRVELRFVDGNGDARIVDRTVMMQDVSGPYNDSGTYCDPNHYEGLGTLCYSWQNVGTVLRGELFWNAAQP